MRGVFAAVATSFAALALILLLQAKESEYRTRETDLTAVQTLAADANSAAWESLAHDAGPPPDFDVHDRQADGDSRSTVENLVQETVSRIVVLIAVAGKSQLAEQILVEHADAAFSRRRWY